MRPLLLALAAALPFSSPAEETERLYTGTRLKALLVTGGCCHNYLFQSVALTQGVEAYVDIEWTVEREPGDAKAAQIELYEDPAWAEGFDVVVHNECFAKTTDPDYIRKITAAHKAGAHSVVIHCAMHTYRDAEIVDWREFLGVTSKKHDHQSRYAVKLTEPDHPAIRGFTPGWVTPMDELYIVDKLWPNATALATSISEVTGEEHPVVWVNRYGKARVFGTTYGHSDDTFRDPKFIELVARGLLWAAGKR